MPLTYFGMDGENKACAGAAGSALVKGSSVATEVMLLCARGAWALAPKTIDAPVSIHTAIHLWPILRSARLLSEISKFTIPFEFMKCAVNNIACMTRVKSSEMIP